MKHYRVFSSTFVEVSYFPMAWCECRVRGETVVLQGPNDSFFHFHENAAEDGDFFTPL